MRSNSDYFRNDGMNSLPGGEIPRRAEMELAARERDREREARRQRMNNCDVTLVGVDSTSTKSPPAPLPTTGGHGNEEVTSMQAERTAHSAAAVKREIRKIVAQNGHKLGPFDRHGLATCEHCEAVMADHDAVAHITRGTDALGSFNEECCGDDPVQKAIHRTIWAARTLKPGTGFVCLAPCGMIVARSKSGLLRHGYYDAGMARWWRGDAEHGIRERADMLLDWRRCGYTAGDRRRALDYDLSHIYTVEGIGREVVRLHA